jgi:multidrug efflux system membrane fusion protein
MGNSRLLIGFLTGAASAAAIGFVAFDAGHASDTKPAPQAAPNTGGGLPVPVIQVTKKTVPIFLDYVGTTEAIRSVTLQAKATGYLAKQAAPDGSNVKAGDLLYRIDPRDYQAALDQVKAQADKDAAALDYAKVSQARNSTLTKQGWVAKDAYDQVTSSLRQAGSALAADRAAIEAAELNLSYTDIRAPFAGRLGRSQVHEGALITVAGSQLNNLVQLDPIYATFNPSETDLGRINEAAARGDVTAEILLTDDTKPRFRGKLSFLDNTVDRATGTITARATIENPEQALLPGQYLRVRLHVADLPDALLVPQAAIGSSQVGKFVYVVGPDNKADQRFVTLGPNDGKLVVVTKGVEPGQSIIVGNLQKLGPGAPVQPHPADGQSGS